MKQMISPPAGEQAGEDEHRDGHECGEEQDEREPPARLGARAACLRDAHEVAWTPRHVCAE